MTSYQIKALQKKVLKLLLHFGDQRMNTVYFSTAERMTVTDIGVTFSVNHVFKHLKPGKKLNNFHYRAYHNKKFMFVDCLKEYLQCCNTKVKADSFIYNYGKPFTAAAIDAMRRCVK